MSALIDFIKRIGVTRVIIAASGIFAILIILLIYLMNTGHKMSVLFTDLEVSDSGKIIKELDSKGIPYEIISGGSAIKVPQDQVLKIRVGLAEQGIPSKGGIGYEIFDKDESLGTTSFQQNIKKHRALEGELSRTIASLEQIESARVHLVIPERELFSKEKQEPRASVILKLNKSKALGKGEVNAISHLLVTSVPELAIKNITIVDTKGTALKLGLNDEEQYKYGDDRRAEYENRIKRAVEDLLSKSLGFGKATVNVSADMTFDRDTISSEIYDPDSAVLRSKQTSSESSRTPNAESSMDISVANNLPGQEAVNNSNIATNDKAEETSNYEISKTVKNHISDIGLVRRLSVAVLVDGRYKTNSSGDVEYVPLSREELDKISNIVKVSVGFQSDRNDKVEVVNMQFIQDLESLKEKKLDSLKEELPVVVRNITLIVVAILMFFFIVRPIAVHMFSFVKKNGTHKVEEAMKQEPVAESKERETQEYVRKITDTVQNYPQEALSTLRRWLSEGM